IDAADRRTQAQIDAADRRAAATNDRLSREKPTSMADQIKANEFVTEQVQKSLMGKLNESFPGDLQTTDAATINAYTQTILRKMRSDGALNLSKYKTPEELAAQVDRYIVNVKPTQNRKFAPTLIELEPGTGITVEPEFKQNIIETKQSLLQISPLQRPLAVDKYISMLKQNNPSITLAQEQIIRGILTGSNGQ
ncbi:hypothetical protein EBZ39_18505, partial [bacterium]|nr:hypothetical protein [bacterium]